MKLISVFLVFVGVVLVLWSDFSPQLKSRRQFSIFLYQFKSKPEPSAVEIENCVRTALLNTVPRWPTASVGAFLMALGVGMLVNIRKTSSDVAAQTSR